MKNSQSLGGTLHIVVFCFLFDNASLCVAFGAYFEKDIKPEFFFNI